MNIKTICAWRIEMLLLLCLTSLYAMGQDDSLQYSLQIEEVVIHVSKQDNFKGTLSGKVIFNPASMERLPSIMGSTDVLKLLQLTPGVQTSGDMNTHVYVRGGEPGHNLLLYNGAPVYTSGHLLGFFSLFNADHISNLEMSKSGMDARYGGRLSSVIAVSSKQTIPEKVSIKGNVGLLASQATLAIPIGDRFAAYFSGRKTYLELLAQPLLNSTVNNKSTNSADDLSYDFYDGNVTLLGLLPDGSRLQLDFFQGEDKLNINEEELLLNGYLKWKNRVVTASWEKTFSDKNRFEQQLLLSQSFNNLYSAQGGMSAIIRSDVKDIGYKNKYTFRINRLAFETGLEYTHHTIRPQYTQINNTGMEYTDSPFPEYNAHDVAAYLSSSFHLSPHLLADAGIRANVYAQKNKTYYSLDPRLTLRYQLNEHSFIRSSYNRQNQYVNLLTTSSVGMPTDFWVSSDKDIPAQTGDQFTLGYYTLFLNDRFEFSADIYYRSMKGLTEYNQELLGSVSESLSERLFFGKGRAYGAEFILKKNDGKLTGWLSYAIGKSDRKFPDINRGKQFPAKFDRRHDLSLVTSYLFNPKWDASLVVTYATGNTYTLPESWYFINNTPVKEYGAYNGARMPDYTRTDISVNYWFKRDNGLNFSIYNLFAVTNPVYIFLDVKQDQETGNIITKIKQKKLATLIPSISWRFKF